MAPPMHASTVVPSRPARRAGVIRRALRREIARIREPKRIAAIVLLAVVFALAIAGMWARGDTAGADAQAYWAAVRIWLEGGDPYHPLGPFLPYVYAPWMLPLFVPWALLPWEVAWFVWRGATILLLLWSIRWAYSRRPLPTAILITILAFPMAANLDTGNINLLLALSLFGAQFVGAGRRPDLGPRDVDEVGAGGALVRPAATGPRLGPRVPRRVRVAVPGAAPPHDHPAPGAVRVRAAAGPRRLPRLHLVRGPVVVAASRPVRVPAPSSWREAAAFQLARARRWWGSWRADPGPTTRLAWTRTRVAIRRFVGLDERRRRDRFAIAAAAAEAADPPPVPVEPAEPLSPPA